MHICSVRWMPTTRLTNGDRRRQNQVAERRERQSRNRSESHDTAATTRRRVTVERSPVHAKPQASRSGVRTNCDTRLAPQFVRRCLSMMPERCWDTRTPGRLKSTLKETSALHVRSCGNSVKLSNRHASPDGGQAAFRAAWRVVFCRIDRRRIEEWLRRQRTTTLSK